ncbi:MAG: hypothetical protein ACO1QR_17375 [Chthoniobacteraceae bacterium]
MAGESRTAGPIDFAQHLREQHFSGADCAAAIAAMDEPALLSIVRELPPAFWRTNSNASMLIRQAARSLATSRAPASLLAELRTVLDSHALAPERSRRLMSAAFSGILEAREISRAELVTLLRTEQEADALALLEIWLDFQTPTTPKNDLAAAKQIMSESLPDAGPRREDALALMVVRLWAHRAPPVADAMLFAKSYEQENNVHLLTAGARVLRMANPDELHRRLVQFAPVMAWEGGSIAAQTSIAREDVLAMASQMSDADRSKFLEGYLYDVSSNDPREAAKFAELVTANEAAEPVATMIIQNLGRTADFEGLKAWIGTVPVKDQGKLWDSLFADQQFEEPSASAALYYLQNRPPELTPNLRAIRPALDCLSYDQAVQYLNTAEESVRKAFTPLPSNLVLKEAERLRRENPGGIAPFLDALPAEYRAPMAEAVFQRWWSEGPDLWTNVIEASSDPAVSAIGRHALLRPSFDNLSLAELQAQLLHSVAASPNHETAFWDATERILKLQTSSSEAISFIASLPPGELKDRAVVSLSKKWADLDPAAAADWLAQLPASETRDHATSQLISSIRDDPESALANAAGIQDPRLRFESARTVLRLWRDRDPAIAEAAISAAGFSAEDAGTLRTMAGIGREDTR